MNNLKYLHLASSAVNITVMLLLLKKNQRKKRIWCRDWIARRCDGQNTVLTLLNKELLDGDPASYENFLRMPHRLFKILLAKVEGRITKVDTVMRQSISAETRLQITLRFLATGETYKSLMYATRIHHRTIGKFVPEVCQAILDELKSVHLKMPNSTDEWKVISKKFYDLWDFPHCLGALDGRHIVFKASRLDGSYYRNYKGTDSIVLLALTDAEYRFTYCHVGTNGRISDGGVLRDSGLMEIINGLNLPPDEPLGHCDCNIPYVIVADDAFPLTDRIMKPYSQRGLTHDKRIFNYRLSRARRIVENAFGILANRFRVLLNPIHLEVNKVEIIALACVALHNFLINKNKDNYLPRPDEEIPIALERLQRQCGNRCSQEAQNIRNKFKDFFNNEGARGWQDRQIQLNNM